MVNFDFPDGASALLCGRPCHTAIVAASTNFMCEWTKQMISMVNTLVSCIRSSEVQISGQPNLTDGSRPL